MSPTVTTRVGRPQPGAALIASVDERLERWFGEERPILGLFGLFCGLILIGALFPLAGPVILVLLAVHALRGSRQTIEAYLVLSFVLMTHGDYGLWGVTAFRWLVFIAALLRMLWDARTGEGRSNPVVMLLALFFAFEVPIALLSSRLPTLSLFKLTSFAIGSITIYAAFERTRHLGAYWRRWFLTYFIFVILASVMVYGLGTGYQRSPQGFQGILGHPQLLGPFMAVAGAWLASRTFQRPSFVAGLITLLAWGLVLQAGSRGAALAGGLGSLIAGGQILFRRSGGRRSWVVDRLVLTAFVVAGVVLIVGFERVGQAATDFLLKDEAPATAGELFYESRGDKVNLSLENFRDSPLLGVGFGTPSEVALVDARTEEVYGVVVGASSEKGFLPTAVLEETGLFGAAFVTLILIAMALPVHRRGSFGVVWVFWAALLVNVGDSVLLSLGSYGLLVWLFTGFAYSQSVEEGVSRVWPEPAR